MGSRAVALVCRDADVAAAQFGAAQGETGVVYTRTGRSFFELQHTESLLSRLRSAIDDAGLWSELDTEWLLLDGELLPWSAKAGELLRTQYAPVAAAARSATGVAIPALQQAADRGLDAAELLERTQERADNADAFAAAYRRYCWETDGIDGVEYAPFQVLASDKGTFHDRPHTWHLDVADRLVAAAPEWIRTTRRCLVDTTSAGSVEQATEWWEQLTVDGGEGMVVKPVANVVRGKRGLAQPGVKVRGREYLRLIYGPDYVDEHHLARLRNRNLGHKRSLALREFALGLESLDRAVAGEPLWRVHEAVFGVLALQSDPVDPRL